VILIAIGAMFVAALAVPEAFTAHRLVFGLAFFVVLCSPARDTGARALRPAGKRESLTEKQINPAARRVTRVWASYPYFHDLRAQAGV